MQQAKQIIIAYSDGRSGNPCRHLPPLPPEMVVRWLPVFEPKPGFTRSLGIHGQFFGITIWDGGSLRCPAQAGPLAAGRTRLA